MSYPDPIANRSSVTLTQCYSHGFYAGGFCPVCVASEHQVILGKLDECRSLLECLLAKVAKLEKPE